MTGIRSIDSALTCGRAATPSRGQQPERAALHQCESTWTWGDSIDDPDNPTVMVDPPDNLPVTPAPIFSPKTTCWNGTPIAITNPGTQSTATGRAVTVRVVAVDYAGRTPHFAARGLPPGLTINATTGTIAGHPTAKGHDTTTVMVSDGVNFASIILRLEGGSGLIEAAGDDRVPARRGPSHVDRPPTPEVEPGRHAEGLVRHRLGHRLRKDERHA